MARTKIAVVIVAAGRGSRARMAEDSAPKQYLQLGGTSILARTVRAFADTDIIAQIVPVIHSDDYELYASAGIIASTRVLEPVTGGATRQASVLAGLRSLSKSQPDAVLIHDGARPFVDAALIERVVQALDRHPGAIPALRVADTLKRGQNDLISEDGCAGRSLRRPDAAGVSL